MKIGKSIAQKRLLTRTGIMTYILFPRYCENTERFVFMEFVVKVYSLFSGKLRTTYLEIENSRD
jgi:hypothetical protein